MSFYVLLKPFSSFRLYLVTEIAVMIALIALIAACMCFYFSLSFFLFCTLYDYLGQQRKCLPNSFSRSYKSHNFEIFLSCEEKKEKSSKSSIIEGNYQIQ